MKNVKAKADLLFGVKAISGFINLTPRQVHYLIDQRRLPYFKIGNRVCCREGALNDWLAQHERRGGVEREVAA